MDTARLRPNWINQSFQGTLRGTHYSSGLLITFIPKSKPEIVSHLVLERTASRKFRAFTFRARCCYRHSLPVDSHGLSLLSLALLCLISISLSQSLFHCHLANSQSAHVTQLCKGTCVLPTKITKNTAHIPVPTFPLATLRDHT